MQCMQPHAMINFSQAQPQQSISCAQSPGVQFEAAPMGAPMTHPAVTMHSAPPQIMAPPVQITQAAPVTTYAAPAVEYSQPAQVTTYAAPPVQAQVSYLPPVLSSDPQMA